MECCSRAREGRGGVLCQVELFSGPDSDLAHNEAITAYVISADTTSRIRGQTGRTGWTRNHGVCKDHSTCYKRWSDRKAWCMQGQNTWNFVTGPHTQYKLLTVLLLLYSAYVQNQFRTAFSQNKAGHPPTAEP